MFENDSNKSKPNGTPDPNAPKQQLAPKNSPKTQGLKGSKVQPGSPFKSESTPVGVQQGKFESQKHTQKRVDKMFKDTNQPTLGVWNKNNKHPMSAPDSVQFNPKFKYQPTKEQLEAARRKKIMQAGFAPKNVNSDEEIDSFIQKHNDEKAMKNYVREQAIMSAHDKLYNSGKLDLSGNVITKGNIDAIKAELGDDYPEDEIISAIEEHSSFRKPANYGQEGQEFFSKERPKVPEIGSPEYEEAVKLPNKNNDQRENREPLYTPEEWEKYNREREMTPQEQKNHLQEVLDNAAQANKQNIEYDPADEPGSGVVSKKLVDFARDYLIKDGMRSEFVDSVVNNLHKDNRTADFFKKLMKKGQGQGSK